MARVMVRNMVRKRMQNLILLHDEEPSAERVLNYHGAEPGSEKRAEQGAKQPVVMQSRSVLVFFIRA